MPINIDYDKLRAVLSAAGSRADLYKRIVNAPFDDRMSMTFLYLGIIVLLLVDETGTHIKRIALSDTELAQGTTNMSVKRFEDISIPLDHPINIIAKAIATGTPQDTTDWKYLFTPELKPREARLNQAGGSIAYSAVYPLDQSCSPKGAIIYSYHEYPKELGDDQAKFMDTYTGLASQALGRRPL